MAYELGKVRVRQALKPRREPYWGPAIGRGKYLGLRKIAADRATWIARLRTDAGTQNYRSLGHLGPVLGWDEAKAAATDWFKAHEAGVRERPGTVEAVCKLYVEDRRREKGKATAQDAEDRFERTVYDTSFGRMRVDKIRAPDIRRWRDGLGLSKASANRTFTSLRAALNLAVRDRSVAADRAQEWASVKHYANAGQRRTIFLDVLQRRALLEAAGGGALRDLLQAAAVTGCRPGELVSARRSQFDGRTGHMVFKGKTGTRTVPLSPAALALFTRLSKGKLPGAYLLTRDDGKPWLRGDWDHLVREAAGEAKLPAGTVLYSLRHSFITQAISNGMSTLDVARLTGTSLQMIEQHYGHLSMDAAAQRLKSVELI